MMICTSSVVKLDIKTVNWQQVKKNKIVKAIEMLLKYYTIFVACFQRNSRAFILLFFYIVDIFDYPDLDRLRPSQRRVPGLPQPPSPIRGPGPCCVRASGRTCADSLAHVHLFWRPSSPSLPLRHARYTFWLFVPRFLTRVYDCLL